MLTILIYFYCLKVCLLQMCADLWYYFIDFSEKALGIDDIRSENELVYRRGENIKQSLFFTAEVVKMMNCALSLWIYFLYLCAILDWPWQCEGGHHVAQHKLHIKNTVVFCAVWRKVWHDKTSTNEMLERHSCQPVYIHLVCVGA